MTDKKDWIKTDADFKDFIEKKKEAEAQIRPEECSNENCKNIEERMTTILIVSEEGSATARRLCKPCVSAYLDSRK